MNEAGLFLITLLFHSNQSSAKQIARPCCHSGLNILLIAKVYPVIKLWQGAAFAILVTIGFHGVMLPVFHWSPPLWQLPFDELFSETLGHILWMWTIEIVRRDIRNRITKKPTPEFQ